MTSAERITAGSLEKTGNLQAALARHTCMFRRNVMRTNSLLNGVPNDGSVMNPNQQKPDQQSQGGQHGGQGGQQGGGGQKPGQQGGGGQKPGQPGQQPGQGGQQGGGGQHKPGQQGGQQ